MICRPHQWNIFTVITFIRRSSRHLSLLNPTSLSSSLAVCTRRTNGRWWAEAVVVLIAVVVTASESSVCENID